MVVVGEEARRGLSTERAFGAAAGNVEGLRWRTVSPGGAQDGFVVFSVGLHVREKKRASRGGCGLNRARRSVKRLAGEARRAGRWLAEMGGGCRRQVPREATGANGVAIHGVGQAGMRVG